MNELDDALSNMLTCMEKNDYVGTEAYAEEALFLINSPGFSINEDLSKEEMVENLKAVAKTSRETIERVEAKKKFKKDLIEQIVNFKG